MPVAANSDVNELAEYAANFITTALDVLKVQACFMIIISEDDGATHIITDVDKSLIQDFAAWATSEVSDPQHHVRTH